jgi:hypothetical protein
MRMCARTVLLIVVSFVAVRSVHAQTVGLADDARAGVISAGAFVGLEFDNADHAMLVGGDGRIRFGQANLEVSPRYLYRPFADGSMQQVDINFLTNYRLSNPGRFRPYSGLGLGVHRVKFDSGPSSSDVGLNLISGVRLAMRPGAAYEPFLNAQYTILKEPSNSFTLVVGASFSFR